MNIINKDPYFHSAFQGVLLQAEYHGLDLKEAAFLSFCSHMSELLANKDKQLSELYNDIHKLNSAKVELPKVEHLKDHEISELVNRIRDIAVKYVNTQQLREQISREVVKTLKKRNI